MLFKPHNPSFDVRRFWIARSLWNYKRFGREKRNKSVDTFSFINILFLPDFLDFFLHNGSEIMKNWAIQNDSVFAEILLLFEIVTELCENTLVGTFLHIQSKIMRILKMVIFHHRSAINPVRFWYSNMSIFYPPVLHFTWQRPFHKLTEGTSPYKIRKF